MGDDFGVNPELGAMARRLRELVKKAGGNQCVAELADVPLSTLNTVLAGKTDPRLSTLRKLAPALGLSVSQLIDEVGRDENTKNRISDDVVLIPMREVCASAGPGIENGDEPISGHMQFPAEIVRSWGRNPAKIEAVQVFGDSMLPTIADRQWVLIDRSEKELSDGNVFAFRTQDGLRLKRFQRSISGAPMLVSDNRELYAPEVLQPSDLEQLRVAGRVFLPLKTI